MVSIFLFTGCGPSGPRVNLVDGLITLDGVPLTQASVAFVADSPDSSPNNQQLPFLATGMTDENGRYNLTTVRGGKIGGGAMLGKFNVTINKKVVTNPPPPGFQGNYRPIYKQITPKKFGDEEESGIVVEVVKGKNVFNFGLKSDGSFEISK